ncbi:MAG: hypothetical protein HC890_02855 [Chloroflexaceae bacterium]|nr:hypothetical protein [Chloroflexaceae bacterium]
MSRPAAVDSSPLSLKAVLGSLNLSLEAELARYQRQHQAGQAVPTALTDAPHLSPSPLAAVWDESRSVPDASLKAALVHHHPTNPPLRPWPCQKIILLLQPRFYKP